jgi:hypothetical protein
VAGRGMPPFPVHLKKKKKNNKYSLIFSLFGPYSLKFLTLLVRNFGLFLLLKCGGINVLEFIHAD